MQHPDKKTSIDSSLSRMLKHPAMVVLAGFGLAILSFMSAQFVNGAAVSPADKTLHREISSGVVGAGSATGSFLLANAQDMYVELLKRIVLNCVHVPSARTGLCINIAEPRHRLGGCIVHDYNEWPQSGGFCDSDYYPRENRWRLHRIRSI